MGASKDAREDPSPPFKEQGQTLLKWRAGRPVKELLAGWVDPRTGKQMSVSRYQHWEYGNNAVPAKFWTELSKRIGHPVGPLYAGNLEQTIPPGVKMVRADVVLPLVRELKTRLDVLESMIVKAVPNKDVRKAGFRKRSKTPVEA